MTWCSRPAGARRAIFVTPVPPVHSPACSVPTALAADCSRTQAIIRP
jgi:hypothetical protein